MLDQELQAFTNKNEHEQPASAFFFFKEKW